MTGRWAAFSNGNRILDALTIGHAALDRPDSFLEEMSRVVVGVRLHVLRKTQRDSAGGRPGR